LDRTSPKTQIRVGKKPTSERGSGGQHWKKRTVERDVGCNIKQKTPQPLKEKKHGRRTAQERVQWPQKPRVGVGFSTKCLPRGKKKKIKNKTGFFRNYTEKSTVGWVQTRECRDQNRVGPEMGEKSRGKRGADQPLTSVGDWVKCLTQFRKETKETHDLREKKPSGKRAKT